jgi:hypothetical protein
VAKYASGDAYEVGEISQKMPAALAQDWRSEVRPELVNTLRQFFGDGRQSSLFAGPPSERLEAMRSLAAGGPLGNVLIDCAIEVASEGRSGPDGPQEAARRALLDRAFCRSRQVEAHYRSEATERSSANVRRRMETSARTRDLGKLSAQLVGTDSTPVERSAAKQTGVDEGPRL